MGMVDGAVPLSKLGLDMARERGIAAGRGSGKVDDVADLDPVDQQ